MRIAGPRQTPPALVRLRPALALGAALLAIAVPAAGCGSSSNGGAATGGGSSTTETARPPQATTSTAPQGAVVRSCAGPADAAELRVVGASCNLARATAAAWGRAHACTGSRSSRRSCTIGPFRCQSATTDRGAAVSCASPGRSISFISRRG